jgi:putative intracellular protease/amidase
MPWRIEDEVRKLGADYIQAGAFRSFAIRDGNLVIGRQTSPARKPPSSSKPSGADPDSTTALSAWHATGRPVAVVRPRTLFAIAGLRP